MTRLMLAALAVLAAAAPIAGAPAQTAPQVAVAPAASGAVAVVDMFHAALGRGDTAGALRLLSDDALIYEGGAVERSKAEYASHHLGADAAFSKEVKSTLTRRVGRAAGQFAWIASEGRNEGTFRGRAIRANTTETMVLRRTGNSWRIVHIHWSSKNES
jgi:ketosteroid isomerase-like protein